MTAHDDSATRAVFRAWSAVYDHPLFQRGLFRRVHRALLSLLDDVPPPRTVLDLGCGTGLLTADLAARYADAVVVGADLSIDMLRAGHGRLERAVCASVDALPFRRDGFELVVSSVSMHWWTRPDRALAEVAAVVAPGGHLAVAVPSSGLLRVRPLRRAFETAARGRVHLAPPTELFDRIATAGFHVAQAASVFPGMQLVVARRRESR